MSPGLLKRNGGWLPAALVLVVVLVAGYRLIVLSVQQHAQNAHQAAWAKATVTARAIESQLQSLAEAAKREAERGASALSAGHTPDPTSIVPARNAFWISANAVAVASHESSPTVVNGIMSEWSAAQRSAPTPSVLGPTRQGSQWIIAALVPIVPAMGDRTPGVAWSVVYTDLDQLLSAIHLGRVVDAGYMTLRSHRSIPVAGNRARSSVQCGAAGSGGGVTAAAAGRFLAGGARQLSADLDPATRRLVPGRRDSNRDWRAGRARVAAGLWRLRSDA